MSINALVIRDLLNNQIWSKNPMKGTLLFSTEDLFRSIVKNASRVKGIRSFGPTFSRLRETKEDALLRSAVKARWNFEDGRTVLDCLWIAQRIIN